MMAAITHMKSTAPILASTNPRELRPWARRSDTFGSSTSVVAMGRYRMVFPKVATAAYSPAVPAGKKCLMVITSTFVSTAKQIDIRAVCSEKDESDDSLTVLVDFWRAGRHYKRSRLINPKRPLVQQTKQTKTISQSLWV